MNRALILKKKQILKKITWAEYKELLDFVEKVYLSDYEMKILLARKCSNLFFSLIELVREEEGGRVRQLYENKFGKEKKIPLLISDRALCFFTQSLKNGDYQSILIVDDLLIHGRTVVELYDKIKELVADNVSKIDVYAYVANNSDLVNKVYIQNAEVMRKLEINELRGVSDKIVDIFYLTGQPYTSYIPNMVLALDSKLGKVLQTFVNAGKLFELNDADQGYDNINSYAWIAPQSRKNSLFDSVRIYFNEDLNRCVVVPMVSLMPIDESVLNEYKGILKKYIKNDYYEKVLPEYRELNYRLVVYVISTLWGKIFFEKYLNYSVTANEFKMGNVEEINFGNNLLDINRIQQLSLSELECIMDELEQSYVAIDKNIIMNLHSDFTELGEAFRNKLQDESKLDISDKVSCLLQRNGELDEERWKKSKSVVEIPKRIVGYPLISFIQLIEEDGVKNEEVFEQLLKAIDYGNGSIVTKSFNKDNVIYYVSVLHAGERNYKYCEKKYFPFLYALLEIERIAKKEQIDLSKYKEEFVELFWEEISSYQSGYNKEDMKRLSKKNISKEYKTVLIRDQWYYSKKQDVEIAIKLARKIMGRT